MQPDATGLDEYRRAACTWLEANMERRTAGRSAIARTETRTDEDIAQNHALQRRVFEAGYAGITFPTEYGGQGLTAAHEAAFRDEAARFVMPDLGGAGGMTMGPIAKSMIAHASPDMCRRHIPKMLSGETVWCQFYSEPEAGSDLAGIRTTATRDGDRWVINGSKIWTTGASYSDWAMCLARTDWDVPKHRGLTWFAIATDAPGVTVNPIPQIDGNAGFCQEFLDGVVVTDDDIFGELNQGWTVAQTMLVYERGGGTPMVAGLSAGAPALAPDLVALARTAGRTDDPVARQLIALAHTNDYALTALGRQIVARLAASDTPNPAVAAYAKLASGTYAPIRARVASDIGGAHTLLWPGDDGAPESAVNFLNGRMVAIASGTNEMQRNGIGERVLGLPREPNFDSAKPFSDVVRNARNWDYRVKWTAMITYDVRDRIAYVAFARPERHNAVRLDEIVGLGDAFLRFDGDPDADVAILHGPGTSFSSGGDLHTLRADLDQIGVGVGVDAQATAERRVRSTIFEAANWKPMIAAIHGNCLGNAIVWAFSCDLVVAASTTRLQITETQFGLATTQFWLAMGAGAFALDVALTARNYTAEEGHRAGVIARISDEGEHLATAESLAREILANPQPAIREIIRVRRAIVAERMLQVRQLTRSSSGSLASVDSRRRMDEKTQRSVR